jgi:hypothetical protein
MRRTGLLFVWMLAALVVAPRIAAAQTTDPQPPSQSSPPQAPERNDPDVVVDPMQPDFNLTALPTTLRMPAGKWAFRVTHRFTRDLGEGDLGDLVSDLFGLDRSAQIGLEVRYGLLPGTQIGIHRTSDRTIQLFGQHSIFSERGGRPFGMDVIATFEGWDNLSEQHQGAFGLVLSKNAGRRAAGYIEPIVSLNSNPSDVGDEHTFMLGVGGRVRVTRTMYLMGEWVPRVAGYTAFADQVTFGVETRAGGHLFQINAGNGFGTTLGQVAQGTADYDRWYLGFSIARKFF